MSETAHTEAVKPEEPAPTTTVTADLPKTAEDVPVESTQPAVPEPENAFTKEFTDLEKAGVKELRSQLHSIAEEAYGDKTKPISIWGVELSSEHPTAKASVVLVKFIRARPGDVAAAKSMLILTLKWREEFKVDDIAKEQFDDTVFSNVGVISGKDKSGRPVTYNFYGAVDQKVVFADVDKFLRWRVGLMERGIALIDFETIDSMVQVHDYDGVSFLGGRDPNAKAAAGQASKIFSDYYPEFLHKKFFVSVPVVLTWIFWTFTKVLSPATQAKMTLAGSGADAISKELLPLIDVSQLPKRYGGEGDDI